MYRITWKVIVYEGEQLCDELPTDMYLRPGAEVEEMRAGNRKLKS